MDKEIILKWFAYGDRDLASANHLLSLVPTPYENICYFCEQAVEKYLKGYLIHKGENPAKNHDIDKLCQICKKYDDRFDEVQEICDTLVHYGVKPRYPDSDLGIDNDDMLEAIDYAQKVKNFEPVKETYRVLASTPETNTPTSQTN
jgi:HEPN domain-containing protein